MIKQSFSEKNLRKIFDLENRKGNNLEKTYFENVAVISEQIKQNKKNIRNILRLSKQDLTKETQLSRFNEERNRLKEKKDNLLSIELEKISQEIISNSFICEIKKQNIKDKDVYTIDTSNASTFFLLKQIQYNLKYIFKIKQSNVNFLLSQLKISLSNRFPKIIFKIDISSFYESIPRDKVILQLIDDPKLSLQTRKTIKYIFDTFSKNNPEVQGFPRGIGLSAYLSEYYMKDFDEFFRTHSDCSFYARYVDDIILIFNPPLNTVKIDYEALIRETLKTKGLELNQNKKKIININDSNAHFDYLGYVFNIKGNQLHSVNLRESRIISYHNKIALCFISYLRQLKKAPNKAAKKLENRLRYLTSNTRLIHNKQNVMVGIYFSNKLITDMKQLENLDSFLLNQIETDITDEILKVKLSSYSFKNGFLNKEYIKFPKKFIKEIQKLWKYGNEKVKEN